MSDPRQAIGTDSSEVDACEAFGAGTEERFPIVAIGASAGGLEAFDGFFTRMPLDSGMAFVLIQHLDPTHRSMLPELVAKFTAMPVYEITDGMRVVPNSVYVIPPDRDLGILHGTLHLLEPAERRGLRHPIDSFFRSLALDQGAGAIGIVLSGTGTEGTGGLRDIKEAGGIILVQDPDTAKYNGMPRSAVGTGLVDLVLPIEKMPENLLALVNRPGPRPPPQLREPEAETSEVLKKILLLLRTKSGHDFWQYKRNTIVRRIDRRMAVHRLGRMADYLRFLQHYPQELDTLFRELLIGVTRCFRDTEAFEQLRKTIIPALVDGRGANEEIRVWVTGCSTGEEAVSIALMLHDRMDTLSQTTKVQVFATDIDSRAISVARRGFYPASIAVDVPPEFLQRYFVFEESGYRLSKTVRDSIVYAEQNLVKDPPFSRLDLISCRNVMIYMGGELQKKIVPLFHYALKPGGFLFLGTSESIGDASDSFATVDRKMKIFRRRGGVQTVLPKLTIGSVTPSQPVPSEEKTMENHPPPINLPGIMEKLVLANFTPPAVLVNAQGEVLCIHGRTGKFLEPAPGIDARNLLQMAREGLKVHLSSALRQVFEQDAAVSNTEIICPRLRVRANGNHHVVNLRIRLLDSPPCVQGLALVVFEAVDSAPLTEQDMTNGSAMPDENLIRIRDLEQNLRASNDYLKTTIEELETANEELKSTNEELQSTNEELQSINEEHETSKEELQSVNEELVTVNCELEVKICELASTNNDMINLLASTEIATLFLDYKLCIKRYTPEVVRIFHLIQSDVGRPLRDIANIDYPALVEDARGVLESLIPRIKEASAGEGRWYKVRIMPYRTTENVIDGVVITFIDVSDQKVLEVQSRLATVVRDSNDAVTVMDFEGRLLAWNRGAERIYGLSEADIIGRSIYSLYAERQHDEIKRLLGRIFRGEVINAVTTERELADGRKINVQITATGLRDEQGRLHAVATTERETSASIRYPYDIFKLIKEIPIPITIEDYKGTLMDMNCAAESYFFSRTDRSMIGLPSAALVPREDYEDTKMLLDRCRKGESICRVPGRRLVREGGIRRVILSMTHFPEQGGAVATIVEGRDVAVAE